MKIMKTMHLLESRCKMSNANISQLFLQEPGLRVLVASLVLHKKNHLSSVTSFPLVRSKRPVRYV